MPIAGADRCALGAERHVDFKSMRQVRDDNPSRYRAIRREAPAGPSGAEAGATPAAVLAAQEAAAEAPSASTSAAMAGAAADLDLPSRLSSKLRIKPSDLHISLYRTGRDSLSKQVKDEAKRLIPSIRAACDGFSFGSVLGTKIVLKLSGGDYNEAYWRVLA